MLIEAEKLALNKRACELRGICWHEIVEIKHTEDYGDLYKCRCGHKGLLCEEVNPDFTTDAGKVELMRLMDKFPEFEVSLFSIFDAEYHSYRPQDRRIIFNKYLYLVKDTTGLLLKAAVEWMEEHHVK